MTRTLSHHGWLWSGLAVAALMVVLVPGAGGCSAPALPGGYYEAQKLERAGRYAEAQEKYAEAARTCKKKRPECALVTMRSAQMYEKMKQPRKAAAAYVKLAQGIGAGLDVGARALYRAGVVYRDLGEGARAETLWWETIDSYPQQIAADDALEGIIARHRKAKSVAALLPRLKQRYRRFIRNDIADNLLFRAAQLLEQDLASPEAAVTLYLELARAHPGSPLFDDALWLAGGIRRKQKRFKDAILLYNQLLATREDAFGGASYLSEWMDNSQLEIAKIRLMDLHQPKRAQGEFEKVVSGFDTSVLRDDAQFWIVLCEVERGRLRQAKAALKKLQRDYPDSRYVRRGAALDRWFAFRRAARAKRSAEACRHWARLRKMRPRPWLARHAPKLPPWPACASRGGARRRRVAGPGRDA